MTSTLLKASFGEYNNKLPRPQQRAFEKFYVHSNDKLVVDGVTILDESELLTKQQEWRWLPNYRINKEVDVDKRNAVYAAYDAETNRLLALFKADLMTEYNMVDHPKADMLFQTAWDFGHNEGYARVVYFYHEMHKLVI